MAGGLGRFNFKFKAPHANVHFKAHAPKVRMKMKIKGGGLKIKGGGLKIKGGGLNLNKAAKAFASPFENIGRSATGLATGLLDTPGSLLQTATGLVSDVAQAAGQMAPELLQSAAKMGLDSFVPGAGSLLNNLFPGSSSGTDRDMPSISDAAAASDQAAQMLQQQAQKDPGSSDMLKYVAIGGVGLAVVFLLTNNQRGRK